MKMILASAKTTERLRRRPFRVAAGLRAAVRAAAPELREQLKWGLCPQPRAHEPSAAARRSNVCNCSLEMEPSIHGGSRMKLSFSRDNPSGTAAART
jgi:hypothetical protein